MPPSSLPIPSGANNPDIARYERAVSTQCPPGKTFWVNPGDTGGLGAHLRLEALMKRPEPWVIDPNTGKLLGKCL